MVKIMGNVYQQYYTKSNEIVSYMIDKLNLRANSLVLEPCAGDGVFIDAVLEKNIDLGIDAFELDPNEAKKLKRKYSKHSNIIIRNEDTLLYNDFINGAYYKRYDYIIANPPYGAWQDYEKRDLLKNIYPNLYIKETYSTFLYLCIKLLKDNGRLVFITPDTYLNLHMHTHLRRHILQNTTVEEIALFPSKFFPGVNFGYSKLSIITLINNNKNLSNTISVLDNFKEAGQLNSQQNIRKTIIKQGDILENNHCAFILSDNKRFNILLKNSPLHISDIAYCVTGIYTGNDKKFIKVLNHAVRNSKNYEIITETEKSHTCFDNALTGFDAAPFYIPIVKGGNTRYLKSDLWFIDWSKDAVTMYKSNKKSRFQNSQFYFKQGIAVPMVGSNSVSASILNNRLFDQSIVGVFPKDEKYIYYLLAFFNAAICSKLLRIINPSANNSANYIKKLPVILPEQNVLEHINHLTNAAISMKISGTESDFLENELNTIFDRIYNEHEIKPIVKNKQRELFAV
jgi:phospholipid N-methyltransferase